MLILSHRGYWKTSAEKNLLIAFQRSFALGYGTELDLRDDRRRILVAHDMPDGTEMPFETLLEVMAGRNLCLALNIKADGLAGEVRAILKQFGHTNYFVFDMSIADQLRYHRAGMNVYTGLSDLQPNPVMLQNSQGIWLDSFAGEWFTAKDLDNLLMQDKKVCVVSAELHGRSHLPQWNILKQSKFLSNSKLLLCSDFPEEATFFFGESAK